MAYLLYHAFAFFSLFSYGIYHLISATRSLLRPPPLPTSSSRFPASAAGEYIARPYHPLPLPSHRHHLLVHLPLYLALLSLLLAVAHYALLLSSSPNLARFTSLQSSTALSLFLLLAASLLLPSHLSLPNDVVFLIASLSFALLSAASSHYAAAYNPSDLQSKCAAVSSLISAASAALAGALALAPRLFLADLTLAASLSLQGLWSLQTGLSLYVDGFIPDGCHRLLDVPEAEASTRCDLEDSRLRAAALLDLAFFLHTTFTAVVTVAVYVTVARTSGGLLRRHNGGGSYEALPTSSSSVTLADVDHVQMKAITKNSMQA